MQLFPFIPLLKKFGNMYSIWFVKKLYRIYWVLTSTWLHSMKEPDTLVLVLVSNSAGTSFLSPLHSLPPPELNNGGGNERQELKRNTEEEKGQWKGRSQQHYVMICVFQHDCSIVRFIAPPTTIAIVLKLILMGKLAGIKRSFSQSLKGQWKNILYIRLLVFILHNFDIII